MLKQRTIFFFWLPLALSWLMMTIEGPWVQGVISRKADPETQLAAFGLVFSLSVTIEAPVIMLLATSNALSRDRQSYRLLWRYMMIVNVLITILAALMAFTPLLDVWLGDALGVPQNIIEATRPAMAIMIFWSAFIGHRRFHQGILIHFAQTRIVGQGTLVRILSSAAVALSLGYLTDLPGAVIGAWALILAVISETFFIYWKSLPFIQKLIHKERSANRPVMTYQAVMRFHIPLAITSLITLLIRPLIEKGLASTPNAENALAAWAVVFSILLMTRAGGLSWQEVVITLGKGASQMASLQRFTWVLGLGTSGFLALMAWTPLMDVYLADLLDVPTSLQALITTGCQVAFMIPLLTTLQSYLRGALMLADHTAPIYQGMVVNLVGTALMLWLGLALDMHPLALASIAMTLGMVLEMGYLWFAYQADQERLTQSWDREALLAASEASD